MTSLEYIGCKLAVAGVQPVMSKLGSLLEKEVDHVWKVDDKLRVLQATYLHTQALLTKLDSISWHIKETTLEPWLQDLDRYCYDIEDIVDDLVLSFPSKEEDQQHPVRSYIVKSFRLTIPHQIGELQKKLEDLNILMEKLFSAGAIISTQPQNGGGLPFLKSLLFDKTPLVHGTSRDKDKQVIVSELISEESKHCGVSILGMDGLGKTSLARTVLLDERIILHFPLILSASVSGHFQLEDIVQKLVRDSTKPGTQIHPETTEPAQILQQLLLCSGKSLIILDDLWSVAEEVWEYFKYNYMSSCPGWRILITTRNPKVAEVTESNSFYLDRMTDEDCKKLIIHRGMLSKFECENWSNDIEVIAKRCMGMPILANKLGLKLSKKQIGVERKNSIIQFTMDKLSELQEFREVFPSLNLNEPKLPPDLKRCFAYCSLFPTSHEFNKEDLIQLWEVEGFTQSLQTKRLMQGKNHHFEDLLSRSILQPFKSRDKKQPVYKMHEFNHEFAQLLASKAFCRLVEGTPNLLSCRNLRHLSLACHNTNEALLKKIEECEGLRTFLLLHHSKPKTRIISYNFFHKLHRLRLLDLSHTNISNLPKSKFPSKHLRFLDLSYTSITKLPESVCYIRALRILKLKGCSELLQLPNDVNQLTNLTHLHVDMKGLGCLPSNIGKLTKLEVLDSFSVGEDDCCKVLELRNMRYLKELHIFGLENIVDMKEAQETMLSEKALLRMLVLEWDNKTSPVVMKACNVLEGLEPHSHLENFVLRNYPGQKFPTWLVSPSCQLVSINLDSCPNCEALPSLSQLPVLKNLVFRSIHNVKTLDDKFCGEAERVYPCLELLEFHDMKGLVRWSGLKAGDMPLLRAMKFVNCPMLNNLPSFEPLGCLMCLEINNCPVLVSLPELPSSMNRDSGELVLIYSALVAIRCEAGGADWPKIKDIPYVEIDATRVITKLSTPSQNMKGKVSTDAHQPPTSTSLVAGNGVIQAIMLHILQHKKRQQTRAEVYRSNKSKGKQKVDEGSSSNQAAYLGSQDSLPLNNLMEQTNDRGTTNEGQLTSLLIRSTASAPNVLMTAKVDDVKAHPRRSKRRRSLFHKYLFCCFCPVV
ncbi:hypothetical protein V2J09_003054 [Rumex salicifolius]